MTKLTKRDKILLIGMGVMGGTFALATFLFLPALETNSELSDQSQLLLKKEIEIHQHMDNMDAYLIEITAYEQFINQELGIILDYLPNEDLAIKIAGLVVEQDMKTLSLTLSDPSDTENEAFKGNSAGDAILEEFLAEIEVEGDTANFNFDTDDADQSEDGLEKPPTATLSFEDYLHNAQIQQVSVMLDLSGTRMQFLNLLDALQQLGYVDTSATTDIPYVSVDAFNLSGVFYMYGDSNQINITEE